MIGDDNWEADASCMEVRAGMDRKTLDELLDSRELRTLRQYEERRTLRQYEERMDTFFRGYPAASALKTELGEAYVESMFKPRTLRERGRIARVKLAVERAGAFVVAGGLEDQLWCSAAARSLHSSICDVLRGVESFDALQGWLEVIDEMTHLMVLMTETTRGDVSEDDEELEELLIRLAGALEASAGHADCLARLRDLFELT